MSDNWSATSLIFNDNKVSFENVNIPSAEAAFSLTSFCKKLEKQSIGFNFRIENVEFDSKEDADALIRSISKIPLNIKYESIHLWKSSNSNEIPQTAEEAFIESLEPNVPDVNDSNPFQESN